ncbi:MAG: OmpH family outer membrane protein [Myxococcota bacterium]
MTRNYKMLLPFVLLAAIVLLFGTGAQDEGVKVGVVDIEQALNATDEGKAAREELSRKQREADAQVQPMVDQYKQLQEEMKGKRYVLSDEALFAKQADLLELQNKIDNKIKELQGQLKIDQGRLEAPLVTKLRGIVEAIGKDEGFTMILNRGTPGLLYTREALDITDKVIERFNKKS